MNGVDKAKKKKIFKWKDKSGRIVFSASGSKIPESDDEDDMKPFSLVIKKEAIKEEEVNGNTSSTEENPALESKADNDEKLDSPTKLECGDNFPRNATMKQRLEL